MIMNKHGSVSDAPVFILFEKSCEKSKYFIVSLVSNPPPQVDKHTEK